jgi:ATP-dependent DNA helicase RecQ
MLYARKDKGLQSFFITNSDAPQSIQSSRWRALDNLVEYAEGGECRHAEILTYYQDSQRIESCGHCDVCIPASERLVKRPIMPAAEPRLSANGAPVRKRTKDKKKSTGEVTILTPEQHRIFEILRMWRKEKARELDVPAFVVFSDRTLRHMAQVHPHDLVSLKEIYGLGDAKVERFGSELLNGPLAEA